MQGRTGGSIPAGAQDRVGPWRTPAGVLGIEAQWPLLSYSRILLSLCRISGLVSKVHR